MAPKKASARLRRRADADLESDSEFEPTPLALLPAPGEPPGGLPRAGAGCACARSTRSQIVSFLCEMDVQFQTSTISSSDN